MIILMHEKFAMMVIRQPASMRQFALENRIPDGTPILFARDIPEEDAEGHPIFAFKVSAGEFHYWSGEPIKFEWKQGDPESKV